MKKYTYFVSYNYSNNLCSGYGRCEFYHTKIIDNMDDIELIENVLKIKHTGVTKLIVLNYKLLRIEEG